MTRIGALARKYRSALSQISSQRALNRTRLDVSGSALRGEGLEIGALHRPLRVPRGTTVRYVDRLDVAGLRAQYPELRDKPLVAVELIDDGETLAAQPDASQDFVIANHFIEHTEDPIRTLENHLRVLRHGGHLYLAVPMKDATFDIRRPLTPLAHLIRDYNEGPTWSRLSHFEEWVRLVDNTPEADVAARVAELQAREYSIHYHVWDEPAFLAFLHYLESSSRLPMRIVRVKRNGHELIVLAQKS